MPTQPNTSDPSSDANSASPSVLDQAKPDVHSAKTAVPSRSVVQPVQSVVHPRLGYSLWLWLGLAAIVMVAIVLGFLVYSKFKFRRKPSLGKRNDSMINRIGDRQQLLALLRELQEEFKNPGAKSNLKYEYEKSLRSLVEYKKLGLNSLSFEEGNAFDECIVKCEQYCIDAKRTKEADAQKQKRAIEGFGANAARSIGVLINQLSTPLDSASVSRSEPVQGLGQREPLQTNRSIAGVPAQTRTSDAPSPNSNINSLRGEILRVKYELEKRNSEITDLGRKIVGLNQKLGDAGDKCQKSESDLEQARKELNETQATKNKLLDAVTQLNIQQKQQLEKQEAMRQRLDELTSPVHTRTSLPQAATSWPELDNYVQNLLGFADLIDRSDITGVTAKLNELQRVLFGPPPMNSLFDPQHPASVDIFTRILYLQNDLRTKLLERGLQVIMPATGEAFDAQRHECAEADLVWDHDDPTKHNTIYAVRTIGFEDRSKGKILKKAAVKKRMFDGTLPPEMPGRDIATEVVPSEASLSETLATQTKEFPVSTEMPESDMQVQASVSPEATLEPLRESASDAPEFPSSYMAPEALDDTVLMPTESPTEVPKEAKMAPVVADSEKQSAPLDNTLPNDNTLNDPAEERKKRLSEAIGE